MSSGSPPRMRGKAIQSRPDDSDHGITPAYAGKSLRRRSEMPILEDHPRVCGEKPADYVGYKLAEGSPPRMRGKEFGSKRKEKTMGITPAYAGKREIVEIDKTIVQDHPRVCGEKHQSFLSMNILQGSPPRMRGKVDNFRRGQTHPGITPAYAGKS